MKRSNRKSTCWRCWGVKNKIWRVKSVDSVLWKQSCCSRLRMLESHIYVVSLDICCYCQGTGTKFCHYYTYLMSRFLCFYAKRCILCCLLCQDSCYLKFLHMCVYEGSWKIIYHLLVIWLEAHLVLESHLTRRMAVIWHLLELSGQKYGHGLHCRDQPVEVSRSYVFPAVSMICLI